MADEKPKPRLRRMSMARRAVWAVLGLLIGLGFASWFFMIHMPGEGRPGTLASLSSEERELAVELRQHVEALAGELGEHNTTRPEALDQSADYVEGQFGEMGYDVRRQTYDVDGLPCHNLEVILEGTSAAPENVVVGGHYDSAEGAPGANDNASGTAAVLALARRFRNEPQERTIRFVAFTNEEPPHFQTESMGSLVYANSLRDDDVDVVAMLSIETIGYYSDEDGSQSYPFPLSLFYPSRGDFVAFVSDTGSRDLLLFTIESFRNDGRMPSEGGALPGSLPGIDWSDHWSFWQAGYPGVMVSDTAPFRYPHYHEPEDTPDKLDYERTARVVAGLEVVVTDLANGPASWR